MGKLPVFILTLSLITGQALAQSALDTQRQIYFSNFAANESGGMANTLLAMATASIGAVLPDTCIKQSGVLPGEPLIPLSAELFSRASLAYIASEVQAANIHKTDIENRNTVVQELARRMRIQGGGDAQKIAFAEAKVEREYLFVFTDTREVMITPLIAGFSEASSQALDESDTPENFMICTGTLAAALGVAENLGIAFQATVGNEPAETVRRSIGGVVEIVAAQILPLMQTPTGRAIVAQIASEATSRISGELALARTGLGNNIADIQTAMDGFESDLGVAADSGLALPRNEVTGTQDSGTTATAQTSTTTTAAAATTTPATAGSGAVSGTSGASSATTVRKNSGTCAVKTGVKLSFSKVCANPVQLSEAISSKAKSISSKTVIVETTRMVNALAKGDMEAARVAAKNLGALAAAVSAGRSAKLRDTNTLRLRSGKPMLDLDKDTKAQIAKMTVEIKKEVTKRGGESLLASTSSGMTARPLTKLPESVRREEFDEATLPARLRGKRVALAAQARAEAAPAKESVILKEAPQGVSGDVGLSLWDQLTNRYRARFPGPYSE